MSQRDLPIWARGASALLLLFASWWLVNTEALRGVVGDSIAPLSLGIVAASILRGMGLPLGLWPSGPWRKAFAIRLVPVVALVFAIVIVLARASASVELLARLDRGTYVTVITGVVAWGFVWALVKQGPFLQWYALAAAAAVVPIVVALVLARLQDGGWPDFCFLSTREPSGATLCEISVARGFLFLVAVDAATALVTVELAFRRLLIGLPRQAGLALILGAAAITGVWSALIVGGLPGITLPWWLAIVGAVGAGCLYVLSGSLLVSGLYTALLSSSYYALDYGDPSFGDVASSLFDIGGGVAVVHVVIVVAFGALVVRRNGLLGGIG